MLHGHVDTLSRTQIAGWAANAEQPEHEVAVRVTIDGSRLRVAANDMRPDLLTAFPQATGRYGFSLNSELLPLSPFVEHEVEVAFADTGVVLPGGTARIAASGSGSPSLSWPECRTPIVLTGTGRSGSSLLMALLSRHPDILVARDHPYEVKLISYYAQALRVLLTDADRERSADPDTMTTSRHRYQVGFNPYHSGAEVRDAPFQQYWASTAPDILRASFRKLIDGYYDCVAERTGKRDASFFAEKIGTVDLAREAATFIFREVREVIIVRDPRDVICSSKAFWHRGFSDSVKALRGQFVGMSRPRREQGVLQHVVRYEDLLNRRDDTLSALCDFLGLAATGVDQSGEAEAQVFQRHATSASPAETIGRWRRELTKEECAIANERLQPFLERFGYEAV